GQWYGRCLIGPGSEAGSEQTAAETHDERDPIRGGHLDPSGQQECRDEQPWQNEGKRLVHRQLAPVEGQGEGARRAESGPKIEFGLTESFVGCLVAKASGSYTSTRAELACRRARSRSGRVSGGRSACSHSYRGIRTSLPEARA